MVVRFSIVDNEIRYKEWFGDMWVETHGKSVPASKENLKKFEDMHGVKFGKYDGEYMQGRSAHRAHYIDVPDEAAAVLFRLKWP